MCCLSYIQSANPTPSPSPTALLLPLLPAEPFWTLQRWLERVRCVIHWRSRCIVGISMSPRSAAALLSLVSCSRIDADSARSGSHHHDCMTTLWLRLSRRHHDDFILTTSLTAEPSVPRGAACIGMQRFHTRIQPLVEIPDSRPSAVSARPSSCQRLA